MNSHLIHNQRLQPYQDKRSAEAAFGGIRFEARRPHKGLPEGCVKVSRSKRGLLDTHLSKASSGDAQASDAPMC